MKRGGEGKREGMVRCRNRRGSVWKNEAGEKWDDNENKRDGTAGRYEMRQKYGEMVGERGRNSVWMKGWV